MGRRNKQKFPQKGNTNGQKAHKKMLHITRHQGDSNQNEITSHTRETGTHSKEQKQPVLAWM